MTDIYKEYNDLVDILRRIRANWLALSQAQTPEGKAIPSPGDPYVGSYIRCINKDLDIECDP